ncbi:hypothetical protein EMIT0P44_100060 [Pseudomonas sp. IT-P44]
MTISNCVLQQQSSRLQGISDVGRGSVCQPIRVASPVIVGRGHKACYRAVIAVGMYGEA